MKAALVAEYRKHHTRGCGGAAVALAAYLGFIGGVMGFSLRRRPPARGGAPLLEGAPDLAAAVYSLVNAVGYVFPLVIGSLAITTEFRHQPSPSRCWSNRGAGCSSAPSCSRRSRSGSSTAWSAPSPSSGWPLRCSRWPATVRS